jgi:hypothetical protein
VVLAIAAVRIERDRKKVGVVVRDTTFGKGGKKLYLQF